MKNAHISMIFAATALFSPVSAIASPTTSAAAYVPAAGASDLYEKTSSEIVLKHASHAQVKSFAQMMITDHTKTTAQVKAAATASGMKVAPPKLMPEQAAMIAALQRAPHATVEKVYLSQQVTAHEKALALHKGYSTSGDKPALRKVAASAVPIVETHLSEVRKLAMMK